MISINAFGGLINHFLKWMHTQKSCVWQMIALITFLHVHLSQSGTMTIIPAPINIERPLPSKPPPHSHPTLASSAPIPLSIPRFFSIPQSSSPPQTSEANQNETTIISTSTTIHDVNDNVNKSNWW